MSPQTFRARVVALARRQLLGGIRRWPRMRKTAERAVSELERALMDPALYGGTYFDPKEMTDAGKSSGYADYRRETSNLDAAAYLIFKHLRPDWVLDVGAARGFLMEGLSDAGIKAFGLDISHDAVASADDPARSRMVVGSATQLPFATASAPVIALFETLEHLPPRMIGPALRELRRVTSGFIVATIPSFGSNDYGPDGWFPGKVRWEVLEHYQKMGSEFEGPVPYHDLMKDPEGNPIEGHVTIAAFSWWTKRFEEAGLERCGELEERMNPDLGRFGLLGDQIWHLYVFRVPGTPIPSQSSADQVARAESVLRLPAPGDAAG